MSFLDLYAGSGAVGLEAASRGATRVTLVERDPRAARVIRENIARVAVTGVELVESNVATFLERAPAGTSGYDIVFVGLELQAAGQGLAPGVALGVVESEIGPLGFHIEQGDGRPVAAEANEAIGSE